MRRNGKHKSEQFHKRTARRRSLLLVVGKNRLALVQQVACFHFDCGNEQAKRLDSGFG